MITLYKKTKTGKTQVYTTWVEGNEVISSYGELNGKLQVARVKCEGKNIGRSNETTPEEQANKEMLAKVQLKRDKGYFDSIQESMTKEVFLPMLAYTFTKREKQIQYPVDVQPKLDGVRCLAYFDGKVWRLMSRGGKEYFVQHITDKLNKDYHLASITGLSNLVLDGELYIHETQLQEIVSAVKKSNELTPELQYVVYDAFDKGKLNETWLQRKNYLSMIRSYFPSTRILTTFSNIPEIDTIKQYHDDFVKENYEGIIIREHHGTYEMGHRSSHLLKYKEFIDEEFPICGYTEGKGKYEGCVIWICKTKDEKWFNVVPKGTLDKKKIWYQNAEKQVGKALTVRYQALTQDGIPQFPVGIIIRDYE